MSGLRFAAVSEADVYVGDRFAATLERGARGGILRYDGAYLRSDGPAIATTLPKREAPYEAPGENLHPFFVNLLPEGIRLGALARSVKSSKDDFLSMLVVVGGDTIGDVSVFAKGESPTSALASSPVVEPHDTGKLSFARMWKASLDYAPERSYDRAALPGVQDKLSARHATLFVRSRKAASYILKLSSKSYPYIVENELFFMRVAKAAGIVAAHCEQLEDGEGARALLVTRFDRTHVRTGVGKVHQEDACQLLDRSPADKYVVSLREIAGALARACDAPLVAVAGLLRLYAYSFLIGNGDLHAKNIAVHRVGATWKLTPAYDLLSTLPYGDTHMALKLEGRDQNLSRKHFLTFAEREGLRAPAVDAMLEEVCDGVRGALHELDQIGFPAKTTSALRKAIEGRLRRFL